MTTNIEKLQKSNNINAPQSTGVQDTGVQTTESSKAPINMKMSEVENNLGIDEAALTYISSKEFKNLPPEQQIQQLKAKYFTALSTEDVQQILKSAKESLQNTSTQKTNADEGSAGTEAVSADGSVNAGQTEMSPEKKEVISLKTILSDNFQKATSEEKLKIVEDGYFKNDEKYNSLKTDRQKQKYIQTQIDGLKKALGIKTNSRLKSSDVDNISTLLMVSQQTGISLDELKKKSKTELIGIVNNSQQQFVNKVAAKLDSEEFKDMTATQKAIALTKTILAATDDEYKKLPDSKKDEYANKKLDAFIEENILSSWQSIGAKGKEAITSAVLDMVKTVASQPEGVVALKTMQKSDFSKCLLTELKENPNTPKEVTSMLEAKIGIQKHFEDLGIKNYSDAEILAYLENEDKKGSLSSAEKLLYNDLKELKKQGILDKDGNSLASSIKVAAAISGQKPEEVIEARINTILSNSELSQKQKEEQIRKLYGEATALGEADIDYLKQIDNLLRDAGYTDAQIHKLRPKHAYVKAAISHANRNEGEKAADAVKTTVINGTNDERKVAKAVTQDMPGMLQTNAERTKFGEGIYDNKELRASYNEGLSDRKQISKEDALTVHRGIMNSENVSDADKAAGTQEFIVAAKKNGTEEQLYFGRELSKTNNAAVLEGVAAASKSVDEKARAEYNSYVETAAKSFSAETQQKISAAIKTGEVSAETRSKTSTTSSSETTQSAQVKNQTSQTTAVQAERTAVQTSVQTPIQPTEKAQTTQTFTAQTGSVAEAKSQSVSTTRAVSSSSAASTTSAAARSSGNETVVSQAAAAEETEYLEQLRDDAAQNAKQTAEDINESIADYEEEKAIREQVDKIVEELGATGNISMSEKEKIKQQLMSAGSITKVYEIVSSLGAKDIFIDRLLSSGSAFAINSFIKNMDDNSVLEDMYLKASADTVKKEILKKLPEDRVHSLMAAGKIQNLDDLDTKTILSFLNKNLGTMKKEDFMRYAQYLDKFDYERLLARFNQSHGIEEEQGQTAAAQTQSDEKVSNDKTEGNQNHPAAQAEQKPRFAKGESRKILDDGTEIKRKETFAGISNAVDDDAFDVVPQDQTEKAMNDEIYTPGSDAWRQKYGRYDTKPQVAFTMSAMEEESELSSGGIEGPIVSNWKYRGKRPRGINFKG